MVTILKKRDIHNPYLDEARPYLGRILNLFDQSSDSIPELIGGTIFKKKMDSYGIAILKRHELVKKYSHAIPDNKALEFIARYSPIIEIGAGTGYWAYLLQQLGVDIIPVDYATPENNSYHRNIIPWTPIIIKSYEVIEDYPDRTLFLCWPPYSEPLAHRTLSIYRGNTFIYIGESNGGCTGDDAFHELLSAEWEEVECYDLPQWLGIHDHLWAYQRK